MTAARLHTSPGASSHMYLTVHATALTAREPTVRDGGGRPAGRLGKQQGGHAAR